MRVHDYLESFINYERKIKFEYKNSLKLERFHNLLRYLDNPHKKFRYVIEVVGTKGKGSIVHLLSSILKEAGFKVGLYTSPHLVRINERIKVWEKTDPQESIRDEEISSIVESLRPTLEKLRNSPLYGELSFFEVYTAIAFEYFLRRNVDFVVLEAGLGGRLDATNVCKADMVCIGRIDYDHEDKLGNTLEEITREKAGVIKGGEYVVSIKQHPLVSKILKEISKARGAVFYEEGKDFFLKERYFDRNIQIFDFKGISELLSLKINLLGFHQIENACVSLKAIEILREKFSIPLEALRKGLEKTYIPGRMEKVRENPLLILDCAHNPSSCLYLKMAFQRHFPEKKILLVFACSRDKNLREMARILETVSEKVFITTLKENPRLFNPYEISPFFHRKNKFVFESPEEALNSSLTTASKDEVIVVSGSVFLVGKIKEILSKKKRPRVLNV